MHCVYTVCSDLRAALCTECTGRAVHCACVALAQTVRGSLSLISKRSACNQLMSVMSSGANRARLVERDGAGELAGARGEGEQERDGAA